MTRKEWIVSAGIATFVLLACAELRTSSQYCQVCGLRRGVERVFWLGATVRERVRLRETTFHQLYSEYVGPHDRHRWRSYSFTYWFLLSGAGVGCGHLPEVLYPHIYSEDIPLTLLSRLRDRSKAAALLQAIDLTRGSATNNAIYAAIRDLKNVSSLRQEVDWWRKHEQRIKKLAAHPRPA